MAKKKGLASFGFNWWQWLFYVIGWFTGVLNLLFWVIMVIAHIKSDWGEKFFNKKFHRRVYIWGIAATVVYAIAQLILLLTS